MAEHGRPAAAALAVGIGAFAYGVAVAASESSKAVADALSWYKPTGPLSGKTGIGILVWLAAWAILAARWRDRPIRLRTVAIAAFALLAAGFLLTFPPVFDAIAGKG